MTLLAGLPLDALLVTTPQQRVEPWPATNELLAQLIEVVSVPAAERALKEPIKVPRPKWLDRARRPSGIAGAIATLRATEIRRRVA